jgi:3-dehydroquinate synthase class II
MEYFQLIFKEYQDDGKSVVMVNVENGDEIKMKKDVYERCFGYTVNVRTEKV